MRILLFGLLLAQTLQAAPPPMELSIAWENKPRSLDPRYGVDADSQYIEGLLHCSLVDFGPRGELVPYLAQSWEWKTPTELTLKLNPGARFGDGSPVTAQDVKATFDFFLKKDLPMPSPRASAFSGIREIRIISPHEIAISLTAPNGAFLTDLVIGILPAQAAQSPAPFQAATLPKGCGPFLLGKDGVNEITLVRNPHFSPLPKLERVAIKIVKEESTRFAKFQKGEVDLLQNSITFDRLAGLLKAPSGDWKLIQAESSLRTTYVGFQMEDPILKNPQVRKAIALAINKKSMMDHLLKNMAREARTILPPDHPYYNGALVPVAYDPKTAEGLLDGAGFPRKPDGKRFQLSYKTTSDSLPAAVAQGVAADLRRVGIDVKVETLEWGRFKDDVEKGRVQMWGLKWIGFKDPDIYRYAFASGSIPPNGSNRGRYRNPRIDELLRQGVEETNEPKRKDIYREVQKILGEDNPYVFLWHEMGFALTRKNVEGLKVFADGRYGSLREAWVSPGL
jgi:peptide/nickel transport system substrate-binding protein